MLNASGGRTAVTVFVARHASGPAGIVQLGPGVHVVDRQNLSSMVLAHSGYCMFGCWHGSRKKCPEGVLYGPEPSLPGLRRVRQHGAASHTLRAPKTAQCCISQASGRVIPQYAV